MKSYSDAELRAEVVKALLKGREAHGVGHEGSRASFCRHHGISSQYLNDYLNDNKHRIRLPPPRLLKALGFKRVEMVIKA